MTRDDRPNPTASDLSPAGDRSVRASLAWAGYLGVSWTWCIGMFLPVLLLERYGWWAVIVFALPNIVGAAAMGWVLRSGQSQRLVQSHGLAMVAFSWVTIGFHALFLLHLAEWAGWAGGWSWPLWLAPLLAVVSGLLGGRRGPALAWAVWVCSLVVMVLYVAAWPGGEARWGGWEGLSEAWPWNAIDGAGAGASALGGLAAVCLVGFAACPYLDLTFHEARQSLDDRAARRAFSVGFGVVFGAMICFTLVYAAGVSGRAPITGWMTLLVLCHVSVQAGFTVGRHARAAIVGIGGQRPSRAWRLAVAVASLAVLAGVYAFMSRAREPSAAWVPLTADTGWYVVVMAFYGLVFPAYLLVCMLPVWRSGPGAGVAGAAGGRVARQRLGLWVVAVGLAAPLFWAGFVGWGGARIEGVDRAGAVGYAGLGVAVVLAAAVVSWAIGRRAPRPGRDGGAPGGGPGL